MLSKLSERRIEGNPDCFTSYNDGYIISTYTLDKDGCKSGSLQYFSPTSPCSIQRFSKGILDTKQVLSNLISCCSDGSLLLTDHEHELFDLNISSSCLSYISLDYPKVFTSSLDGNVLITDLNQLNTESEKVNPYEIWSIAVADSQLFIPISIGKLLVKDLRTSEEVARVTLHESDICCVVSKENQVFCGSFDGTLSICDRRFFTLQEKLQIGGGVWRLMSLSSGFLTANMEEGFKFTSGLSQSNLPTGSLAYALGPLSASSYLGCSFYDSTLIEFSLSPVSSNF